MAQKRSSTRRRRTPAFPDRIFALASPRSIGGRSLFDPGVVAEASTVAAFASDDDVVARAVDLLAGAGFEVLQSTSLMINIAGPRELFEEAFATSLVAEERMVIKGGGEAAEATFFDTPETDVRGLVSTDGTRFEAVLEGVAIEEPTFPTATAMPPSVPYFHLDVPAGVAMACNAPAAHRAGTTGTGISVAMVDTGWARQPWFTAHGYRIDPVVLGPGTADPGSDENGHGTGESANVFATAPDCTLKPVKAATASGALVNMTAAFNAAVALGPDIISNSWSSDIQSGPLSAADQARAAAVAAAWAAGIVVVFAAGNGHWGFPGQHPDVISVGGVAIDQAGALRASDYASGFDSQIYPGRRVPDLAGLVGLLPRAELIMLPIPPGCAIDRDLAGGTFPEGDETGPDDGWAVFSGTSAACPQVAGVCALILQACPRLGPAEVRELLTTTARDVTTGTNHPNFGNQAVPGPDNATGAGLADAQKAVLLAKLRCSTTPAGPGPLGPEDVAMIERPDAGRDMSEALVATVVMRPASGRPLEGAPPITAESLDAFRPAAEDVEAVTSALAGAGFEVGPLVGIAMAVTGTREAFERYFGTGVETAAAGGWSAGGARELPLPEALAGRVHAVTFEPPAEPVV